MIAAMAHVEPNGQSSNVVRGVDIEVRFADVKSVATLPSQDASSKSSLQRVTSLGRYGDRGALQHVTSLGRFGDRSHVDGGRNSLDSTAPQSLLPEPELERLGTNAAERPDSTAEGNRVSGGFKKLRNTLRY